MSATRSNPQVVTVSDPTVARQLARTIAQEQATGSTGPVVVTNTETLFNQATASAANAAPGEPSTLTVTSSPANDSGDVVTVYRTTGGITVTAVNETVNQYTSVDSGVSQILAGTGVTITSTGASGTGVVTINAGNVGLGNISSINLNGNVNSVLRGDGTWGADANSSYGNGNVTSLLASFGSNTITTTGNVSVGNISATNLGNIAATNYDGNSANVLHGDGTWSADVTDYGNSNVANYLPTYTGNLSGDYLTLTHDANANVVYANFLYGDGSNISNLPVGNIASINLDGNASNALLGDGTFGPVEVTGSGIANGSSSVNIPVANGNITLTAGSGQWLFDTAGRLEFPGGTAEITSSANYFGMWANGNANTNGVEFFAGNNAFLSTDGSFQLDTNVANGVYSFVFGNDGLFILPSGNTKIGFQYGSDAILTSNSNFGVATQGANVTTFMNWSDDVANTSVLSAIYVNAPNANPGDVHIRTGNIGSPHVWKFNNDGNLGLPDGNSVIQSVPNNAGDLSGLSTLNLYPDSSTGDDRYLVVDPTGPNHIHIRAGGAQDASNSLLFLGGEQAYVQIDDTVHEVQIGSYDNTNATSYSWRFENDGTLTLPGNLVASGASPAPTLSGFSSVQAVDNIQIGNIVITNTDGTSGQVLTTYGNGITYWSTVSGGSYGDSNVASLLGAFGSNTIVTTGIITADGANLSNVPYANLTGAPTLGNISTINTDGNAGNVLYGNGVFAAAPSGSSYGDSNVTTLLGSFGSNSISTTGNVTANNFSGNTNGYTLGYLDIPQIALSADATLGLTAGGKHYYSTTAGNITLTVPDNGNVALATGTAINIVLQAAGNILVNAASGVNMYLAGNSTAANRVISAYGMATLLKVDANTWFISGTGVS